MLQDVSVIWTWNDPSPLRYTARIFEKYKLDSKAESYDKQRRILKVSEKKWKAVIPKLTRKVSNRLDGEFMTSNKIENVAIIVTVFDLPEFTKNSSYNLSGVLTYQSQELQQMRLPVQIVETTDVTNSTMAIKPVDLIRGNAECFLSVLATSDELKLFVHLFDVFNRNFDSILEMECYFKRIDVPSNSRFYYTGDASKHFGDAIIQVVDDNSALDKKYLNMFSR